MAYAFNTISAKPTFGTIKENLYQSDYINRKKAIITYCSTPDYNNKIKNATSYHIMNSFKLGSYIASLDKYKNLLINKNNLIIGQYTQSNLKDVCTVSENYYNTAPSPKSDISSLDCLICPVPSDIIIDPNNPNNTLPFYNNYIIDPRGQLFGKSQCGELNYINYMQLNIHS